jgi:hypothetical protein
MTCDGMTALGSADAEATAVSNLSDRRSVQRRLRPEEVAKIVSRYKGGDIVRDLAEQLGVHRTTVSRGERLGPDVDAVEACWFVFARCD